MAPDESISARDLEVWRRIEDADAARWTAEAAFREVGVNRVEILSRAFSQGNRILAMRLAKILSISERQRLFRHFVAPSSWDNGQNHAALEMILSLPREWVLEHIEAEVEPYLVKGDDSEYRSFLPLYYDIDRRLCERLARRAVAHPDPHIRDVGESCLEMLAADS